MPAFVFVHATHETTRITIDAVTPGSYPQMSYTVRLRPPMRHDHIDGRRIAIGQFASCRVVPKG
jgi:hypothetical protein